ncbi:hypothetical protein PQR34_12620 [Paraburkholderia sediminicola]|uniref:hypothetical protein n=1 Tax=Paraburkholderia sediminicola TaxID=458836 RepID=UPI0038B79B9E
MFLAIAVCIAVVISKVCGSASRLWGYRKNRPQRSGAMDEYVQSLHEAHTKNTSVERVEHRLRKRHDSNQRMKPPASQENASAPHCSAEDVRSGD